MTVIDNASTDGSVAFLRENYPEVTVEALNENKILCSYNKILRKIDEEVVILLNNDLRVDPDFIEYTTAGCSGRRRYEFQNEDADR